LFHRADKIGMTTITLQRQPSRTSCGPTCVAMLANVPVEDVLVQLDSARIKTRPRQAHKTNTAVLIRLLKPYRLTLGRRMRYECVPLVGTFLLRVETRTRKNWHWAVLHNGHVYDPKGVTATLADYPLISWYEVTAID
jgi:hypothetical protein